MELEWYTFALTLVAGFVAGIINTLAGSGSVITISLLAFLGLDTHFANATNRVGVMFQTVVAVNNFSKHEKIFNSRIWWYAVPSVLGSILGSILAVNIPEDRLNTIIALLMCVLLCFIIYDPKKWLREQSTIIENHKTPLSLFIFFLIGIYGGFFQAGVGIFMLSSFVLFSGYNLITANALKILLTLIFNIPSFLIFVYSGQIIWPVGLVLALGQGIGAYVAVRFAIRQPNANVWVRRLLIVMVIVGILKFSGLLDKIF